jgi:hypothetical protein
MLRERVIMKPVYKTLTIQFLKEGNRVNFQEITEIITVSENHTEEKSKLLKEFFIPEEYNQSLLYLKELMKSFVIFNFYKLDLEYEIIYMEEENIHGDIIKIYKDMFDRQDLIKEIK